MTQCILAIDPGSSQSAWIGLIDGQPGGHGIEPNGNLLCLLRDNVLVAQLGGTLGTTVAIEWTAPRGMPASAELFETLWWAGQFAEAARPAVVARVQRADVKRHLCGTTAAKDSNVHAALIDRFGGAGGKAAAVGLKASPGPLYGIVRDVWQALGVAVTYADGEQ